MKTIYNKSTSKAGVFSQPYMVDGNPGTLPSHLIELEVVEADRPEITDTQKVAVEWVADLDAKEYRQVWTVSDKTKQEMAPHMITKAQGLVQLYQMGLYEQVTDIIANQSEINKIVYESTNEWEYDNTLVGQMADALSFTEEQKMDFFINASKIQI